MFLPTHWLYFIDNEGNEENVANTDCSTKQEVRDEAKYILLMYEKQENLKKIYIGKLENGEISFSAEVDFAK